MPGETQRCEIGPPDLARIRRAQSFVVLVQKAGQGGVLLSHGPRAAFRDYIDTGLERYALSTSTGSTRVARRVGTSAAATATNARRSATPTSVVGSLRLTP